MAAERWMDRDDTTSWKNVGAQLSVLVRIGDPMSEKARTVAVVGASSDRRKFGNKAVRAFAASGWRVFPVHPQETSIEGFPSFPSLAEIGEPVDTITVYVPPPVGLRLLPAIAAVHPREVWFNPGAGSPEIRAEADRLGLPVIFSCSIVAIGSSPRDFPDA